jgi:transposase
MSERSAFDPGRVTGFNVQLFRRCYELARINYMREARLRHKEVFVPLAHPPGDAQVDFGEALVTIGGVEQKAHFLCTDLPQSDDCFVIAFPAENTEAYQDVAHCADLRPLRSGRRCAA